MECGFWSSIFAGVITGGFAILAVHETFRKQNQRDDRRQQERIQGVLQAFYKELNTLWVPFEEGLASYWEEYDKRKGEDKFVDYWSFLSPDYLTMYSANASLIPQIKVPKELLYKSGLQSELDLQRDIVEVYAFLQALIDGYRHNNRLIDQLEKAQYDRALYGGAIPDENEKVIKVFKKKLRDYAPVLRKNHEGIKTKVENLLEILRKICDV